MKKCLKRYALLLMSMILMLSACATTDPGDAADNPPSDAKGRYLEELLTLPEGIGYISTLHQNNAGDFILVANFTSEHAMGPYGMWRSSDGGHSWQQENPSWLEEFDALSSIQGMTPEPDGGYYILSSSVDPEIMALLKESPEEIPEDYQEEVHLYHGTDSVLELLPFEVPLQEPYGYLTAPTGLGCLPNGDLLFHYYNQLTQVDSQTGQTKFTYMYQNGMATDGTYIIRQDILALYEKEFISLYDTATGDLIAETTSISETDALAGVHITVGPSAYGTAISVSQDGDSYYLCDSTGIYRTMVGGAVVERLLDGELSSLNMPSISVDRLFAQADDSFYILAYDGKDPVLLRYYYDAEAPSAPSIQLSIYSLEDNSTIRQAMGVFQRNYPDVKINYTVGLAGDNSVTATDAMRTLSTELLAGNGPDILVLDGMPVDSYIQKDILLDLSSLVEEDVRSGSLLRNVVETYRRDGALYAVPARFTVPMYTGPSEGADAARDLTTFAQWLISQENAYLNYNNGNALLTQFYDLYTPIWFDESGTVNETALAQSLSDIYEIADNVGGLYGFIEEDARLYYDFDTTSDAVMWASGNITAGVTQLASIDGAAAADAAIKKTGDGAFIPMENGQSSVFVPNTVLGINGATPLPDIASDFVRLTLSEEVQTYNFSDGLPVNANSLLKNTENPYGENDDGISFSFVFMSEEDGIVVEGDLQILWPEEAFLTDLLDTLINIETPVLPNLVVRQIVFDETKGYFSGNRTLDETVSSIKQKVDLYLAEQG